MSDSRSDHGHASLPGHAAAGNRRRVRVVFVDDNVLAAQALQRFMHESAEVELAACALSEDEALGLVASLRPDVVLLDLDMPGVDTVGLIARLEQARGEGEAPPSVVMFSGHCRSADIERCLAAGAAGYICKDEPTSVIVELVAKAAERKVVLSPVVKRAFLGVP